MLTFEQVAHETAGSETSAKGPGIRNTPPPCRSRIKARAATWPEKQSSDD
jgi:hypothetical protein